MSVYASPIKRECIKERPPLKWINSVDEHWEWKLTVEGLNVLRQCCNKDDWKCICHDQD